MNIYYFTPYSLDKNLGAAYNQYMELLPSDDDWACFLDGDTMFLTFDWGHLIQSAVESHPEAGMFTCYTNRVNNPNQCYRKYFSENRNIVAHRNIAKVCRETCKNRVKQLTRSISGMMMIIQKKTWKQFPFIEGIIGVDTDISKRLLAGGKKIFLIESVYLLHYYRLAEGRRYKKHLTSPVNTVEL
jgi:GT2 family glycosyltransferase